MRAYRVKFENAISLVNIEQETSDNHEAEIRENWCVYIPAWVTKSDNL